MRCADAVQIRIEILFNGKHTNECIGLKLTVCLCDVCVCVCALLVQVISNKIRVCVFGCVMCGNII